VFSSVQQVSASERRNNEDSLWSEALESQGEPAFFYSKAGYFEDPQNRDRFWAFKLHLECGSLRAQA
jgi:hypothetical protein